MTDDDNLVNTLERRNSLTLILIKSVANNSSVRQVGLSMWLLLECQAVLHPLLVVSVWVVLTGVGATRFLACSSCFCSLDAMYYVSVICTMF